MSVSAEHKLMTRPGTTRQVRPGWTEIVVGLVVLAVLAYGFPILLQWVGADDAMGPIAFGVILAAVSGVAGLIAFAVAVRVRVRDRSVFGVRRTTGRWVLVGVAGGLVALVVSRAITYAVLMLFGPAENVQQSYADAAGGGVLAATLSVVFLAVLTPIGEEFLFRGIVTTALLRYGAAIGVVGSAAVFAVMHGLNIVFITAFVVGIVAAELRRRSGSIWPGVVVHVVNNLVAQLLLVVLAVAA
ncbi:CPBP family intramembrane glutamic endopeptidase [Cryptosporangium arvum]|uniref:CPBP family intramembrane glutamic endopeptidase n=1 Tax=Cryptosporangium arvum TaxID=80871 RepID=UPI0004BCEAF9|nr:type II CAAX endopeptidase family protein [Cryptosporangium arvum]